MNESEKRDAPAMFDAPDYHVNIAAPLAVEVSPPSWRLLASDGFAGEIGGTGTIIGTSGNQEINLLGLSGDIMFDASFNKGGDTIHLFGDADVWTVSRVGSCAVLSRSDGSIEVTIPMGIVGATLVFGIGYSDDSRVLRIDAATGAFMLGDQAFSEERAQIAAPVETTEPVPMQLSGTAQLLLPAGDAQLEPSKIPALGGNITVIGTNDRDVLHIGRGDMTLDASFNRGGDVLHLGYVQAFLTAARVGSNAVLSGQSFSVTVPVGPVGLALVLGYTGGTLQFDDAGTMTYRHGDAVQIIDEAGTKLVADWS